MKAIRSLRCLHILKFAFPIYTTTAATGLRKLSLIVPVRKVPSSPERSGGAPLGTTERYFILIKARFSWLPCALDIPSFPFHPVGASHLSGIRGRPALESRDVLRVGLIFQAKEGCSMSLFPRIGHPAACRRCG